MSGNGIVIIESKKKLQNKIYEKFISHIEKEKIDIVEIWSLEKQQLPGYEENIAYTITLNLEKSLENLWQDLSEKTRNSIKKAQKNTVMIQIDNAPKLEKYYELYALAVEHYVGKPVGKAVQFAKDLNSTCKSRLLPSPSSTSYSSTSTSISSSSTRPTRPGHTYFIRSLLNPRRSPRRSFRRSNKTMSPKMGGAPRGASSPKR